MIGVAIGNTIGRKESLYWTQAKINDSCLFYASHPTDLLSKVVATQLPNQVTGSSDYLTVTGVGLNARYRTPNTAPYKTADSDYVFWKTDASESTCDGNRLIGYDFPRILIKYLNVSPYTILAIAILKPGVTVTNGMRDAFDLNIWWSNTLSLHGATKQNKPLAGQYVWTAESVYEAESSALFTRMTAVSETPDNTRKGVLNTAILADKTQIGFTNQYDALWLLAAHGNDSALLNIIKDAHNITLVNTPTYLQDRHYVGGGVQDALNCNYNPSTQAVKYLQDACSYGIYIRNNVDELKDDVGCEATATNEIWFLSRLGSELYVSVNGNYTNPTNTDSRGMWILTRQNATTIWVYHNGTSLGSFSTTSAALPNAVWHIMCRNIAGTLSRYSTRQYALHFIGGYMDQTKVTAFQTIWVDGYLATIGAKV